MMFETFKLISSFINALKNYDDTDQKTKIVDYYEWEGRVSARDI